MPKKILVSVVAMMCMIFVFFTIVHIAGYPKSTVNDVMLNNICVKLNLPVKLLCLIEDSSWRGLQDQLVKNIVKIERNDHSIQILFDRGWKSGPILQAIIDDGALDRFDPFDSKMIDVSRDGKAVWIYRNDDVNTDTNTTEHPYRVPHYTICVIDLDNDILYYREDDL